MNFIQIENVKDKLYNMYFYSVKFKTVYFIAQ